MAGSATDASATPLSWCFWWSPEIYPGLPERLVNSKSMMWPNFLDLLCCNGLKAKLSTFNNYILFQWNIHLTGVDSLLSSCKVTFWSCQAFSVLSEHIKAPRLAGAPWQMTLAWNNWNTKLVQLSCWNSAYVLNICWLQWKLNLCKIALILCWRCIPHVKTTIWIKGIDLRTHCFAQLHNQGHTKALPELGNKVIVNSVESWLILDS